MSPRRPDPPSPGQEYIGRQGMYAIRSRYPDQQTGDEELIFPVRVTAVKKRFGRLYFFITPVGGENHWWVEDKMVKFSCSDEPSTNGKE